MIVYLVGAYYDYGPPSIEKAFFEKEKADRYAFWLENADELTRPMYGASVIEIQVE